MWGGGDIQTLLAGNKIELYVLSGSGDTKTLQFSLSLGTYEVSFSAWGWGGAAPMTPINPYLEQEALFASQAIVPPFTKSCL